MSGTSVIEQGGTAAAATLLIERLRTSVAATSALLTGLPGAASAVGNTALGPLFRQLDDLKRQVDVGQVVTLSEALSRGVVAESDCPTATSWVIQWAPSFRSGGAAQLVKVTQATQAVRNNALAAAVLGARVGVRNAAVVLAEMDKLKPRLGDAATQTMREAIWKAFIQVATDYGPKEIRCLRDMLIAKYGQQGDFQRRQDQLKDRVSLTQPQDDDGIAEYRLRLDPEGKEVLEAMLGPLSAPKPTPGCPDLRNSDQRRGEALIGLLR
jgi:Domain of unknown function (DUF222)